MTHAQDSIIASLMADLEALTVSAHSEEDSVDVAETISCGECDSTAEDISPASVSTESCTNDAFTGDPSSLREALEYFLKDDGLHYNYDSENDAFTFTQTGWGRLSPLHYQIILLNDDMYCVRTFAPLGADHHDPHMIDEMAEFLCLINNDVVDGVFEMDERDGALLFRMTVDLHGTTLTKDIYDDSITTAITEFHSYEPGILQILLCGASAKDAYEPLTPVRLLQSHIHHVQDMLARLSLAGLSDEDAAILKELMEGAEEFSTDDPLTAE